MTDPRATLVDWLRSEFVAEQSAGFPRLRRVPDTQVIRFLDHFASLNPAQQMDFAAILADWSSYHFVRTPLPVSTYEQFAQATAYADRAEGLRYTGVKLLAGLSKGASHGGLSGWFGMRGLSGLALQPPENLLRDAADLVPVKIPTLRKLVNAGFAKLFAPRVIEIGDGIWCYEGERGASSLQVQVRFSGKLGTPQLRYEVAVRGPGGALTAPNLCFESVLPFASASSLVSRPVRTPLLESATCNLQSAIGSCSSGNTSGGRPASLMCSVSFLTAAKR